MITFVGFVSFVVSPSFASKFIAGWGWLWYNALRNRIATIAQPVEQTFRKRQVKGSNPFGGSSQALHAHFCGGRVFVSDIQYILYPTKSGGTQPRMVPYQNGQGFPYCLLHVVLRSGPR